MNILSSALQQEINYLKRNRSIRDSRTIGDLLDAIDGTYYDIFLHDKEHDCAWAYFSPNGEAFPMMRDDPENEPNGWQVIDWDLPERIPLDTRIKVISYPEDSVYCVIA